MPIEKKDYCGLAKAMSQNTLVAEGTHILGILTFKSYGKATALKCLLMSGMQH